MFARVPADVEPAPDLGAVGWVLAGLEPWSGGEVPRLASFMPGGFEAYVRVFHPLEFHYGPGPHTTQSWAEVGAEHGVALTPDVSVTDVLGLQPPEPGVPFNRPDGLPLDGVIPETVADQLIPVLGRRTDERTDCSFCVWEGWGGPGQQLSASRGGRRAARRAAKGAEREMRSALADIPLFDGGNQRRYLLFHGPFAAARLFGRDHATTHPASLWWPADRAWIVATEIDGDCTYVGGRRDLIDDLLTSDLETIEVTPDTPMS